MRLLCILHGGPDHPSSRFRVLQHLEALRARGLEPEVFTAKRRSLADLAGLRRLARAADAVLIQKKLFTPLQTGLLLGRGPLLFDMDDAYFAPGPDEVERYGAARAARRAARRARRLRSILRRSRRVIAGNRFLAEHARRYAADVAILPTGVDLRPYPIAAVRAARERRRSAGDGPRLGWIGSRPSRRYLEAIAGPLRTVCARNPGARLVQIADAFVDLPGVPCERRVWNAAREAEDLMGLDLGLMPLDDTSFARGKCGFKILQYHAAALPVVCAPIGANREIVTEGETGLFAADAGGWVEAIGALLAGPGRASALGEAGRRRVEERYDAGRIGAALADLVASAAAAPGREGAAAEPGRPGR